MIDSTYPEGTGAGALRLLCHQAGVVCGWQLHLLCNEWGVLAGFDLLLARCHDLTPIYDWTQRVP